MSFGIENQEEQGNNVGDVYNQALNMAASGPMGMLWSVLGQDSRSNQANHRENEMMHNQYQLQRKLNQQGHDLQYDLWNKTYLGS